MRLEEIEWERDASGWNPYADEEEAVPFSKMPPRQSGVQPSCPENPPRQFGMQPSCPEMQSPIPGMMQPLPPEILPTPGQTAMAQPFFAGIPQEQILEEQQNVERDLRALQSMFPDGAKILLPYIEEECDRLEYEGSPMFDGYPDRETIYRIQDRIYNAAKDQFPEQPQEAPDDMLTMQYRGRRRNPPGKNWLEDMIRVMLLQEMHHRRCRHGRCRRSYGR